MRDDRQRLLDILEAAKLLVTFRAGKNRADLTHDLLLQSGFLHQLFVIGEAASRLSPALKKRFPNIPWYAISGFRNYIAHEYFSLDLDIVWQTVIVDVPLLETQIREILRAEAPGLFQDPSPPDS
jgi:uncharacterized protein with HEPN domain